MASLQKPGESFADAPAMPFLPSIFRSEHEMRAMLADRKARLNRRRCHLRPPLAMAVICLLSSTSALFATSSRGEAEIASWVAPLKIGVEDARTALLGPPAGRQISFNGPR